MLKTIFVLPDGTELSSGTGTVNAIESVTITECVNGAQDLTLGSVCANMIEAKIITPEGGLSIAAGEEITVYKVDETGRRYRVGIFSMENPTRDKANRLNITAYDRVARLDKDLTNWLKNLGSSYTLLNFAKQVCVQCGLQLVNTDLPNGDYIVPSFTKSGVTGRQLMKWIGEACGRFCRATVDGKIEFAWYTPVDMTIGPHEIATANLTVDSDGEVIIDSKSIDVVDDGKGDVAITSEALSISDGDQGNAILTAQSSANQLPYFQGSFSYEDYLVAPIDAVQLSIADGQDGYLWPEAAEGANSYIISSNPIINRATDDMRPVIQTILNQIMGITYTPCKISIPSNMNIHAGNIVQIADQKGKVVTAYIMTKTQTGQKDTLESTGNHRRDSTTAQNNKSMDRIAQEKVDAQTQADIFNKLTDNGRLQGLYIQDGKLYINGEFAKIINLDAESIVSGVLYGLLFKAGVIESLDGRIKIDLGQNAAEPIFNTGISTNGLNIRADEAGANSLFNVDVYQSEYGSKPYYGSLKLNSANGKKILRVTEGFSQSSKDTPIGGVWSLYSQNERAKIEVAAVDGLSSISLEAGNSIRCSIQTTENVAGIGLYHNDAIAAGFQVNSSGESDLVTFALNGKKIGWFDNEDGTYTLMGID